MPAEKKRYFAAIGERVLPIDARNAWEAGYNSAIKFTNIREGELFFAGQIEMQVCRPGVHHPLFAGKLGAWLQIFTEQGRSTARWGKIVKEIPADKGTTDPA